MSRRETDHQPLPEELAVDIGRLREALAEVRSSVVDIAKLQPAQVATSSASNNNHFGSAGLVLGVIFSAVCCTAMLTGGAVYAFMTSNQVSQQNAKIAALEAKIEKSGTDTDQKLSSMQDYLSVIYQYAPQLKPKEKTK